MAGLEKRKRRRSPPPQPVSQKVESPAPEPEQIQLLYPVWVVHKKQPFAAELKMTLPPGTEMGKDGLLEVREGDWVEVEVQAVFPKTWFGENLPLANGMVLPDLKARLRGSTVAPEDKDGDCDFVLLDDSPIETAVGQQSHPLFRIPRRYPILTNLREFEPASPLNDSNCDLYEQEPESDFFGRGNFRLLDGQGNHAKWAKGILSDNRNKLSYVLVKRVSDSEILLRQGLFGGIKREFVISLEVYIVEEVLYFPLLKAFVTRLTLKEELLNGQPVKLPRQVYFIEGQECLENIELLDGLYATCRCDDGEDYFGWIEYDGDYGLKLNLDKSKRPLEDDYIRVVLDDPDMIQNY